MKQLYVPKKEPMRLACFMSGSGTNVRKLIEQQLKLGSRSPFKVIVIFTNNKSSNAAKIAAEHKVAFLCNDIKDYYVARNAKLNDMNERKNYDAETKRFLQKNKVDAVALCGYMSIATSEIVDSYVTINVHPADLRRKDENGRRIYAGMQGIPSVKAAILNGDRELRSTIHLVTSGLDEGPIIMVSKSVKVMMDETAERNMERLKEEGDWEIYPEAVELLAEGRLSIDEKGNVYLDGKAMPDGYELNG